MKAGAEPAQRCQFVGTVNGKVVPCPERAEWRMRLRTVDGLGAPKPWVCGAHMTLMMSHDTKAHGRDWEIVDRHAIPGGGS